MGVWGKDWAERVGRAGEGPQQQAEGRFRGEQGLGALAPEAREREESSLRPSFTQQPSQGSRVPRKAPEHTDDLGGRGSPLERLLKLCPPHILAEFCTLLPPCLSKPKDVHHP